MSNILKGREFYKPLQYPQLFQLFETHERMHWFSNEVKLDDDIKDWHYKLGDNERKLLTELFRFFVGADNDVLDGYANLLYHFQRTPEVAMVLASIAAREGVHLHAYSLLIDTIGMPENIYSSFLEYEAISAKHDYVRDSFKCLSEQDPESRDFIRELAKVVCITGCFTEGLQLFSSFAVLKNFEHTYKAMPGMNDIVDWSIRDEDIHIQTCAELFKILCSEYKDVIDPLTIDEIQQMCRKMVELEFRFIDLMFDAANNDIKGLTKDELKQFIMALANGRLAQFGIEPVYPPTRNPLKWLDFLIYSKGHTSFFERRATEYGKGSMTGELNDDAFAL